MLKEYAFPTYPDPKSLDTTKSGKAMSMVRQQLQRINLPIRRIESREHFKSTLRSLILGSGGFSMPYSLDLEIFGYLKNVTDNGPQFIYFFGQNGEICILFPSGTIKVLADDDNPTYLQNVLATYPNLDNFVYVI